MDDFGTGYSSLNYLRSFPFDKIKIDRCFISGLATGDDSVAIVLAIAGLAKHLGIATTAEGVETRQQLQQVKALGCSEMQGFLFSPPRRIAELTQLVRARLDKDAPVAPVRRQA
jgi:EAL domain-containing protein (putative c-di-GMP-specific phosphodiesterase class I)